MIQAQSIPITEAIKQGRYEAYERERLRVNEITDLAERIPLPMSNTFEYEFASDGHLYYLGESIGDVVQDTLDIVREAHAQRPDLYARHLLHAEIERSEYDWQRALACGSGDDPDVLVVMSPQVNELAKHLTMIRIYTRTENGIEASSVSFERSSNACLRRVAAYFGEEILADDSPEDIHTKPLRAFRSDFIDGDIRGAIARLHDSVLEEQHGGEWSGGRPGLFTIDARTFIEAQEDIVSDHIATIGEIMAAGVYDKQARLEEARFQTAALLAERIEGRRESPNRESAGESARAEGRSFDNNCPTVGERTVSTQSELGLASWTYGSCRVCLQSGLVGACEVCVGCETADNNGKDLIAIHKQAVARAAQSQRSQANIRQDRPGTIASTVRPRRVGQPTHHVDSNFIVRREITVGGADTVVIDRQTGEEVSRSRA